MGDIMMSSIQSNSLTLDERASLTVGQEVAVWFKQNMGGLTLLPMVKRGAAVEKQIMAERRRKNFEYLALKMVS